MVKLSRIVRDYTDAGGVNTLLAPWGFVQDGIFLTKGGDVGLAYAVRGVDIDGLTHAERHAVAHRMEAALRVLDERTRVYQYLVKRFADRFVPPSCPEPIAQEAASRSSVAKAIVVPIQRVLAVALRGARPVKRNLVGI